MIGRRALGVVGVLGGSYLGFVLIGGFIGGSCIAESAAKRLGNALAAEVKIGSTSAMIATGNVTVKDIEIRRDGVEINIARAKISMPAGGAMVFSQRLKFVEASGIRASLSARGAAEMAVRDRKPLHIDELVLRDATVSISPTLIIPGLGQVEASIESARSRDVNLASAVSWIAKLDEMVAKATLPGGAGASFGYSGGQLSLSGSWFGSNPLSIPFKIPELNSDLLEIDQLKIIGRALTRTVAKHVATDRLLDAAKNLFD